jgi:CheY-like chemotaxis protein
MKKEGDRTILVVEDNSVIIELLERTLGRAGYRVAGCTNSLKYREACLEAVPGLIILDILMPGKTGWEILGELKQDPELAEIPVIVSSVKAQHEDIERSKEMGAVAFIAKPYVFGDLLKIIEEHVR